jgi:hypothetical protein
MDRAEQDRRLVEIIAERSPHPGVQKSAERLLDLLKQYSVAVDESEALKLRLNEERTNCSAEEDALRRSKEVFIQKAEALLASKGEFVSSFKQLTDDIRSANAVPAVEALGKLIDVLHSQAVQRSEKDAETVRGRITELFALVSEQAHLAGQRHENAESSSGRLVEMLSDASRKANEAKECQEATSERFLAGVESVAEKQGEVSKAITDLGNRVQRGFDAHRQDAISAAERDRQSNDTTAETLRKNHEGLLTVLEDGTQRMANISSGVANIPTLNQIQGMHRTMGQNFASVGNYLASQISRLATKEWTKGVCDKMDAAAERLVLVATAEQVSNDIDSAVHEISGEVSTRASEASLEELRTSLEAFSKDLPSLVERSLIRVNEEDHMLLRHAATGAQVEKVKSAIEGLQNATHAQVEDFQGAKDGLHQSLETLIQLVASGDQVDGVRAAVRNLRRTVVSEIRSVRSTAGAAQQSLESLHQLTAREEQVDDVKCIVEGLQLSVNGLPQAVNRAVHTNVANLGLPLLGFLHSLRRETQDVEDRIYSVGQMTEAMPSAIKRAFQDDLNVMGNMPREIGRRVERFLTHQLKPVQEDLDQVKDSLAEVPKANMVEQIVGGAIARDRRQLVEEMSKVMSEGSQAFADKDREIALLKEKLLDAEKRDEDASARIQSLTENVQARESDLVTLRSSLAEKDSEMESLRETSVNRGNRVGELESLLASANAGISKGDSELAAVRASLEASRQENLSVKHSLCERDETVKARNKEVLGLKASVKSLTEDVDARDKQLAQLGDETNESAAWVDRLQSEAIDQAQEVAELQASLDGKTQELNGLQRVVDSLRGALATCQDEHRANKEATEREVDRLAAEVASWRAKVDRMEESLGEVRKESLTGLDRTIQQTESAIQDLASFKAPLHALQLKMAEKRPSVGDEGPGPKRSRVEPAGNMAQKLMEFASYVPSIQLLGTGDELARSTYMAIASTGERAANLLDFQLNAPLDTWCCLSRVLASGAKTKALVSGPNVVCPRPQ